MGKRILSLFSASQRRTRIVLRDNKRLFIGFID